MYTPYPPITFQSRLQAPLFINPSPPPRLHLTNINTSVLRFNYILFIQRLLESTTLTPISNTTPTPEKSSPRPVLCLDIGTGASAIYPLLGTRQHPHWFFLATELDPKSREYAQRNISNNPLDARIKMIETDRNGAILIPDLTSYLHAHFHFTVDMVMTNPPFYSSATELSSSAKQKSRPPNSSCTGAEVEMIVEGGEVGFVTRLIDESLLPHNRRRIRWFSSMLGKLSSVGTVVEILRTRSCTNYAVSEFVQGQKTRRWCVAWSWRGLRTSLAVARGSAGHGVDRKYLPVASEITFDIIATASRPSELATPTATTTIPRRIEAELRPLQLSYRRDDDDNANNANIHSWLLVSPVGDVWSRKARRSKQRVQSATVTVTAGTGGGGGGNGGAEGGQMDHVMKDGDGDEDEDEDEDEDGDETDDSKEPALVARISFRLATATPSSSSSFSSVTKVHIRWIQGHDPLVFESFCGWLKRKLDGRAGG